MKAACLEILEHTGVRLYLQEALDILLKSGAKIEDGNRVRIPAKLVEKALSTAPYSVTIYDRHGEPAMPARIDSPSLEIHLFRACGILIEPCKIQKNLEFKLSYLDWPGSVLASFVLYSLYRWLHTLLWVALCASSVMIIVTRRRSGSSVFA